jgi:Protein of unknown function (DUF499)
MSAQQISHWADALSLRKELTDQHGYLAELQMSLYSAVFHTEQVPYREVGYYDAITQPTPGLVGFMADVMRRLGSPQPSTAMFHLDQGMGGGKSHALVGLFHMADDPRAFLETELGRRVHEEAEHRADDVVDPSSTRVLVLSADHMTPGAPSPEYGPARTLFERFLWSLFEGEEEPYNRYAAEGANKGSLRRALEEVDRPVLVLLDEIMDYALKLSSAEFVNQLLPAEQAFLADLMEAVGQVRRVALVLVMISSEYDEQGYNAHAAGFRDYITARVERNGTKVAVTEPQDFRSIMRRRIFDPTEGLPTKQLATAWTKAASRAWQESVFERLGSRRSLTGFGARLAETYPFHPDLMALVEDDWARNTGFQRVRSTVRIFASSAYHWASERAHGRWAPLLIGVGDVPLQATIAEVLSSGLLDNDRAIQSFRQVAAKDVISKSGDGKAVELDERFAAEHPALAGEHTCLRMATALFLYSLVPRSQARTGATKPELLAAAFTPDPPIGYDEAEEAQLLLTHEDEGLGALDIAHGAGGNTPTRYTLSIRQTLQMFYRQARTQVRFPEEPDDFIWRRVQSIANQGRFDRIRYVDAPQKGQSVSDVFADLDQKRATRLVVLDPHHWTLLNGEDNGTRTDIEMLLGLGDMAVDNAASCVVACVNTQRRKRVRDRAVEVIAYDNVLKMLDPGSELREEAERKQIDARNRLDREIADAFQHYAYLVRDPDVGVTVHWGRFDVETRTSLNGHQVWDALATAGRAAQPGQLSGSYLPTLINLSAREYTVREVVNRFWQDPAFPLVSSEADLRRALYEAITQPALGVDPAWQLVDDTGEPLVPASPEGVAINAASQVLRPYKAPVPTTESDGGPAQDGEPEQTEEEPGSGTAAPVYKRHRLRLAHRSVVDDEGRERVYALLNALTDALEPGGPDVQLVDIDITLTAAEASVPEVRQKADQAEANWVEEDEDF